MNDENLTLPGEGSVSNGGDESASLDPRFPWTDFYEAIADGLMAFCFSRGELLAKSCKLDENLADQKLDDICPFSVMARFNREGPGDPKRAKFAEGLASFLGVSKPVPKTFKWVGIPTVSHFNLLFFDSKNEHKGDDIDTMWELFARALALMRSNGMGGTHEAFIRSYDKALKVNGIAAPTLTKGLYWIRPWFFLPLDDCSQCYIEKKLGIFIPYDSPNKKGPTGKGYLKLRNKVAACFNKKTCSAHSFPELTWWPEGSSPPDWCVKKKCSRA